ncbi:MAG: hypothetical protein ACI4M5_06870 [Christensenellales bacterium]
MEEEKIDLTATTADDEVKSINDDSAHKPKKKETKIDYFSATVNQYGVTGAFAIIGFILATFFTIQETDLIEVYTGLFKSLTSGVPFAELFQANMAYIIVLGVAVLGVLVFVISSLISLFSAKKIGYIDEAIFVGIFTAVGMLALAMYDDIKTDNIVISALVAIAIFVALMVALLVIRTAVYTPNMTKKEIKEMNLQKIKPKQYLRAYFKKFNPTVGISISAIMVGCVLAIMFTGNAAAMFENQDNVITFAACGGAGAVFFVVGLITRLIKKRTTTIDLANFVIGATSLVMIAIGLLHAFGGESFDFEAGKLEILAGAIGFGVFCLSALLLSCNTCMPVDKRHEDYIELLADHVDETIVAPIDDEENLTEQEQPIEEIVEQEAEPEAQEEPVQEEPIQEEPIEEEQPEEEQPTQEVEEQPQEVAAEEAQVEEQQENIQEEEEEVKREEIEQLYSRIDALESSLRALGGGNLEPRVEKLEENGNTLSDINIRVDNIEKNVQRILDMLLAGAVATTIAPVVEQPVEEEEEVVEPIAVEPRHTIASSNWQEEVEDSARVKPKLSFEMKLRLADDNIKSFYSELKNELLSYGIKNRISRFRENFNKGRNQIARFTINGKTLVLYLAIDPASLDESYYHHKDCSDKKGAVDVPTMLKIRSKVAVKKAKALIEMICEGLVIKKKKGYEPENFADEFSLDGYTTVECKGLDYLVVGDLDLGQAMQLPDSLASQLIEVVEGDEAILKPVTATISVDDILANFEEGSVVDIESVISKKMCPADCNYLSVVEGQRLNKKYRVFANEYNPDAVKMICLAGGEAFLIVDPQ